MSIPSVLSQDALTGCILIGLVAVVGIIGNSIMLRALIKYDKLRIDIYLIFCGLALADICHLCFAAPFKIMDTIQAFEITTDTWCKVSKYVIYSTGYVASYHVVVLSVLRGIVLTNRGHASPTAKHAFICSIALWIVALLSSIPVFFIFQKDPVNQICDISWTASLSTTIWLDEAFTFFLPLALILAIYGLTYYVGKQYFAESYSGYAMRKSRLINGIVIVFVICQFPYQVINLHLFYEQKAITVAMQEKPNYDFSYIDILYTISDYLYCLLLAGTCIRPILYAKLADDLGETFDEVINCTYCSKHYHTVENVRNRGTDEDLEQIQL